MANAVELFVRDVFERAGKTAAQAALLAVGEENLSHLNALHVSWVTVGGFALGGFVVSILTSLASQPVGDKSSASLIRSSVPVPAVGAVASAEVPAAVAEAEKIFPLN